MTQLATVDALPQRSEMKTDSIASGLSFMLIANVLQRGVGFLRNLGFCCFLSEQQLGLWALASSFLLLAAPLAVLGLPGSLGRFVELYRVRNQLATYLRYIVLGSALGATGLCMLLVVLFPYASSTIFGEPQSLATMAMLSATLLSVITFNFLTELLSGLRQARTVSSMQMVNSLSFTLLGLLSLRFSSDWRGVMASFAIASLLGILPAWRSLTIRCSEAFQDQQSLSFRAMWQRILPYAASVWVMNLLSNLFDVVDRYMLLHLSSGSIETGQAVVGQFHSGRVLPILLTSLGLMINGMILPYLSADWEAGRMDRVRSQIRSTFSLIAIGFWGLSIAGLAIAPWLFEQLLHGRYADGLSIMPLAMVHCIFASLAMLLHSYLWCAERGRLIGSLIGSGLLLNIGLNYYWVPRSGVFGAMLSTLIASAAILAATIWLLRVSGYWIGRRNIFVALLPLSLLVSTSFSFVCFAIALILTSRTDWLICASDKKAVEQQLQPLLKRLGFKEAKIWWL